MTAAMAARRRERFLPNADPNVIPFIDVLLVLLIIFMVTAPKPTTDLRVDLPRPGPHLAAAIPPTIVEIRGGRASARIFVGAEEVSREHLAQRVLAAMLAVEPALTREDALAEGRLFVRADLDVAYQDVVSVVDDLQHAHFQKVAIVAQNADGS